MNAFAYSAVAKADKIANDKFRIGVNGGPGPDVADAELTFVLGGTFFSLQWQKPQISSTCSRLE